MYRSLSITKQLFGCFVLLLLLVATTSKFDRLKPDQPTQRGKKRVVCYVPTIWEYHEVMKLYPIN